MTNKEVRELDYLPVKRAMLEIQRAHYFCAQSDVTYRKDLTEVLFDFLETYAARIACNPGTAYTFDIPAIFSKHGLDVSHLEDNPCKS